MSIFDSEKDGVPILFKLTMNREFSIMESIGCKRWVVGKTTIGILLDLIRQKITLYDALKAVDSSVAVFEKYRDGTCKQKIVDAELLAEHERPEKTAFVRFPEDNCEEEIKKLYLKYFLGQTIY